MGAILFEVNEELISKEIGLSCDGKKYKKHTKTQDLESLNAFFRDNENSVKKQSSFDREVLPKPQDKLCLAIMKYVTLEGRFKVFYFYHMPLLNHLRHKMILNFPFFLLTSLENLIKESHEASALNPNLPPPLPLHHGLILKLYFFCFSLCPPKPISVVHVEEFEPPDIAFDKPSPVASVGPKRKTSPLENEPYTEPKSRPPSKKKGEVGLAQYKATTGLCEVKNKPTKIDDKPTTKEKGKKDTTCQVELPTTNKEGKSVVEKDSKGDTIVATSIDMGTKQTSVRRSHKLAKNKKEILVDDISSDSKQTGGRVECQKDTIEEMEEEFVEGPSHFLDMNKIIKEGSTHSSDPKYIEDDTTQWKNDKDEDINKLHERVVKLGRKFNRLAHFTIKIIHRFSITLSDVIKEEVDRNTEGEGPNQIGDDVLNLLIQKWECAANQWTGMFIFVGYLLLVCSVCVLFLLFLVWFL